MRWIGRIASLIAAYFVADAFVFGFSVLVGGHGGWAIFAYFTGLMLAGAVAVLLVALPGFLVMDRAKLTSVRAGIVLGATVGLVSGVLEWLFFKVAPDPSWDVTHLLEMCAAGVILALVGTGAYWAMRRGIAWVFTPDPRDGGSWLRRGRRAGGTGADDIT